MEGEQGRQRRKKLRKLREHSVSTASVLSVFSAKGVTLTGKDTTGCGAARRGRSMGAALRWMTRGSKAGTTCQTVPQLEV
eukprot:3939345-Rhodomonas_salina.1